MRNGNLILKRIPSKENELSGFFGTKKYLKGLAVCRSDVNGLLASSGVALRYTTRNAPGKNINGKWKVQQVKRMQRTEHGGNDR